jgi:hypothetical protein
MALKQRLAYKLYNKTDLVKQFMIKTGIETSKNKEPLVFKYSALNKRPPLGVNHHISQHSMSLQRSKYICLDYNIDK